jgi:CRP-like cAMP-binding protein
MLVANRDSWLPPKDLDAGVTDFYDINTFGKYTVVFYYAILLIVGNESAPRDTSQTVFASLVVIMGAIVTAFIFGNMAALMATINKKDSHFQETLDLVSTTMRSIKLPEEIQDQVIKYLMHCQESPDMQQDIERFDKFFSYLSPSLKSTILHHLYNKLIKEIEIFDDCTEVEIGFIVTNLKTLLFLPQDEVIRQGDFGNKMYFVGSGIIDIYLTVEKVKKADKKKAKEENEDDKEESKTGEEADEDEIKVGEIEKKENRIQRLREGSYFGEVALITRLKRTATAKAYEYTTLACIDRDNFSQIKREFPQVYLNFKQKIRCYEDADFTFRRQMIKNVPYFKGLEDEIIEEIVYLLKPHRYDFLTTIVKYGDITDKIHFLKQGEIDVTIPTKQGSALNETLFETLNPGSCFCAFSAFSEDIQQLVNFKARTNCVVETIDVQDLEVLERTYLQLSDEIKKLKLQIGNKDKSELDFFRYLKPLRQALSEEVRSLIRRKFQAAVRKFTKICKESATNLPNALVALQGIMRERRKKHRELLQLQRKNTIMYLYEKSPLCFGDNPFGKPGEKEAPLDFAQSGVIPPISTVLGGNLNQQIACGTGAPIPTDEFKMQLNRAEPVHDITRHEKVNIEKLLEMVDSHNQKL